jgi:hypothetical protein
LPRLRMDGVRMMTKKKDPKWTVTERLGVAVINGLLLLPEEERKHVLEERAEKARRLHEEGEPAKDPPYVCPNGCAGPFRTHGCCSTMVGWFDGPDPNHWTQDCSCRACGSHFTKEWVPASNGGKPWFVVRENGKRRVYSGQCQCCCPEEE